MSDRPTAEIVLTSAITVRLIQSMGGDRGVVLTCSKCGTEFVQEAKNRKTRRCRPCETARKQAELAVRRSDPEYNSKHMESRRQVAVRARAKLRAELIEAYGGKCQCCGESIPEFLAIDHIHNDGAKHRKEIGVAGNQSAGNVIFARWLRDRGYPKDRFQLLCHNCNLAKGFYGQCPHQRDKVDQRD